MDYIKFKTAGINTAKNGYHEELYLGDGLNTSVITLGSVLFDAKDRKLIINGNTIDLTGDRTNKKSFFLVYLSSF